MIPIPSRRIHPGNTSFVFYYLTENGKMVGAEGFEPPASWSQTRRSTRLSYAPTARSRGRIILRLSMVGY